MITAPLTDMERVLERLRMRVATPREFAELLVRIARGAADRCPAESERKKEDAMRLHRNKEDSDG